MRPEDLLSTGHPFVQNLAPEHLAKLAEFAMPCRFEHGEWIFREGELANRFYLIRSGLVVVEAQAELGPPMVIQSLKGGDVLGWSWLVAPEHWAFSSRAIERTDAVFFYGTRLREACDSDTDFGYQVLKRITHVLVTRLEATRRLALGRIPHPVG